MTRYELLQFKKINGGTTGLATIKETFTLTLWGRTLYTRVREYDVAYPIMCRTHFTSMLYYYESKQTVWLNKIMPIARTIDEHVGG